MSGSDQQNLMEVTGRSAESLEIMARALHVKNAELQPTPLRADRRTPQRAGLRSRCRDAMTLKRAGLWPSGSTARHCYRQEPMTRPPCPAWLTCTVPPAG